LTRDAQVLGRGAQADARGSAQVLDRGAKAAAASATLSQQEKSNFADEQRKRANFTRMLR
jgi:hypothetical protein